MKKKLITGLVLSLILVVAMIVAIPSAVFAHTPPALDTDVDLTPIHVTATPPSIADLPSLAAFNYYSGTVLQFTGGIDITSEVDMHVDSEVQNESGTASSTAGIMLTLPGGATIILDQDFLTETDSTHPTLDAEANQVLNWIVTMIVGGQGQFTITETGTAQANWTYQAYDHHSHSWITYNGNSTDTHSLSFVFKIVPIPARVPQAAWFTFNGFTAYINDAGQSYQSSPWATLVQPLNKVDLHEEVFNALAKDINLTAFGINVFIPAGTVVFASKTGIPMIDNLGIQYVGGVVSFFTQNIRFSNPVTITDASGKVLLTFTSIVNGVASMTPILVGN